MKKSLIKIKIKVCIILICSLILNNFAFAGQFIYDNGKVKYLDDYGKIVTGWRWLDTNNDNICECYRFGDDGTLATRSRIKGKDVNKDGKWMVDGIVQQIYKSTGKPLYSANAGLGVEDENEYIYLATGSDTRTVNATDKDIEALVRADIEKGKNKPKEKVGPDAEFEASEKGYILSKGIKSLNNRPIATKSNRTIIDDALQEDEIIYLSATESFVAGRDARKFVSASNKYTSEVNGAKIYGGYVWDDAICLQGNDSYVKFILTDDSGKFHANYFTCEIAHQTHGQSTADTDCYVELYLNGKSITTYDQFCDDEPEIVEEWFDDGEKNMELRVVVTGDAPGRKIYIRNARFRQLREVD